MNKGMSMEDTRLATFASLIKEMPHRFGDVSIVIGLLNGDGTSVSTYGRDIGTVINSAITSFDDVISSASITIASNERVFVGVQLYKLQALIISMSKYDKEEMRELLSVLLEEDADVLHSIVMLNMEVVANVNFS